MQHVLIRTLPGLMCLYGLDDVVDASCLVHFLVLLSNGVLHGDRCIFFFLAFLATAVNAFDLKVRVALASFSIASPCGVFRRLHCS